MDIDIDKDTYAISISRNGDSKTSTIWGVPLFVYGNRLVLPNFANNLGCIAREQCDVLCDGDIQWKLVVEPLQS